MFYNNNLLYLEFKLSEMAKLRIAVCQYKLSGDIDRNLSITIKQMKIAFDRDADIALFPECNLSGYPGVEFLKYKSKDYVKMMAAVKEIKSLAGELKIWAIVGGYCFDEGMDLPYNSLFVINDRGEQVCRYDKRLLTSGDSGWDIDYFSAGKDSVIFSINGIRCGVLICHEWRYPELYREYKALRTDLVFQSWYDASVDSDEYSISGRDHGSLIMGAVRSNAANNYLWLAGSNASNRESSIGSFIVRPDGKIVRNLPRNKQGVLVETIDLSEQFIDPSEHNRKNILSCD